MTAAKSYLYESIEEYEIDGLKDFDMKFGAAKQIVLSGYSGEKICVRLASDTLSTLQSDFKVKMDDIKNGIDIEIVRQKGVTEDAAKEAVTIFVQIPSQYIRKVELAAAAEAVEVHTIDCDSMELNIKAQKVILEDVAGKVEIDCNLDMDVVCRSVKGEISINQVSAASKISIPEGFVFKAVKKGIGTSISFEKDGKPTEAYDTPDADNIIELNGMKSELVISTLEEEKNNLP